MTLTFISSGQGSRYAAIYLLFILPFLRKEAFLPRWLVKVEAILWCVASCGWSAHMHTPGSDTYIFIFLSISHTHIAVSGAVMWRWSVNDLTSVRETSLTVFKTSCFSSTSITFTFIFVSAFHYPSLMLQKQHRYSHKKPCCTTWATYNDKNISNIVKCFLTRLPSRCSQQLF